MNQATEKIVVLFAQIIVLKNEKRHLQEAWPDTAECQAVGVALELFLSVRQICQWFR
jgi:hypothetical protein